MKILKLNNPNIINITENINENLFLILVTAFEIYNATPFLPKHYRYYRVFLINYFLFTYYL